MTEAFPLQWPHGRPRTKDRSDSAFRVGSTQAFEELLKSLDLFGAENIVVSSNIPTRQDGTPYRDGLNQMFDDPGVAVYFMKGKRLICLPCDSYRRPWENCRAISLAVDALRAMERHGAQQILDQAFEGFIALPPPSAAPGKSWWEVLNVPREADA